MNGDRQIHKQEVLLRNAMIRAQHGDGSAYRELLGNVRVILQDSPIVDDQVQEILLALHAKRHTYDSAQLFTPWLFAIARYKLRKESQP